MRAPAAVAAPLQRTRRRRHEVEASTIYKISTIAIRAAAENGVEAGQGARRVCQVPPKLTRI
jgi:hypothetical protein